MSRCLYIAMLAGLLCTPVWCDGAPAESSDAKSTATVTKAEPKEAAPEGDKPKGDTPTDEAEAPPSPFGGSKINQRPDALAGVVELSDGTKVPGDIYTTRGQDIVILDTSRKKDRWRRVPPATVSTIETTVDWERMDAQWRFKTAGSPEKVATGKSYPNRRYSYTVTLKDETQIVGRIKGVPLYVRPTGGKPRLFVLHERHKGEVDQKLKDLVYVTCVRFGAEVRRQAEAELAAKAEAAKAAAKKSKSDNTEKTPSGDAAETPERTK